MKIIRAFPPNFRQIAAAFPVKGKPGILYAWGNTIYNPSGMEVPTHLKAHEYVHGWQQKLLPSPSSAVLDDFIQNWWDKYIESPAFRLDQEVTAHRAEWKAYKSAGYSQHDQEMYLTLMAQRLSSKLYGRLVDEYEARRLITEKENSHHHDPNSAGRHREERLLDDPGERHQSNVDSREADKAY